MSTEESTFFANAELRLTEIDLISSMFPGKDEFLIEDLTAVADLTDWINSPDKSLLGTPPSVSFSLRISSEMVDKKLEVFFRLPPTYPSLEPLDLFVRSEALTRNLQAELNKVMQVEISSIFLPGELMCGVLIHRLQDLAPEYFVKSFEHQESKKKESLKKELDEDDLNHSRIWILSHHIKSKVKQRNIMDLARRLTGFMMVGKPGVICLEGPTAECHEVWAQIRTWNWQRIGIKLEEKWDSSDQSLNRWQSFEKFERLEFLKPGSSHDDHTNMTAFKNFLTVHNCQGVFKSLIFKSTSKEDEED